MRLRLGLLLAAALASCTTPQPSGDASPDALGGDAASDAAADSSDDVAADTGSRDTGPLLPACSDMDPDQPGAASTLVASVQPMRAPLAMADTSPEANPVTETGEQRYRTQGLDQYTRGPAQARLRRVELGGDVAPATTRRSLAWFVHFSDTQLVDDESPTRLAQYDNPATSGAIRPQEAYLPRVMSAMNRTLTALARPERPFQFGVVAGDCADSAQSNELQWFMQVMDGARGIETDSGQNDDPIPGPDNDPKDPFDAVPFPAPWYFVPGNHDVLVVGVSVTDMAMSSRALGTLPSTGTRDYRQWYAPVTTNRVPADPRRALLDRATMVSTLRNGPATPGPAGHGFPTNATTTLGANYEADVVPGLLRMIAIDTSDTSGGSPGMLRQAQVDGFLRPALERARTDGVLAVLSSHHSTASMDQREGELGGMVADAVAPSSVEALVASYPNVILWLVGHDHDVHIRPVRGASAQAPGYWEVQSGAIADWPSQARTLELVDNGNGTLSIFGTMIDFQTNSCMERRFRRLALMDFLSGWERDHRGNDGDRNVELVVPLPAAAAARIAAASAAAPTRLESETTLRGMR